MNRTVASISIAAAFAAGCGATHLLRPALAAENITAQIIHVPEMNGEALGLASGTGLRSRMFVSADGATISIQDGNVGKHMHPNANEIQYILDGTGTIWLGDNEVQVKPGDLALRATREGSPRLEDMSLEDVEAFLIKKALARYSGNVSHAASALGLSRSALYRRLQRYGL